MDFPKIAGNRDLYYLDNSHALNNRCYITQLLWICMMSITEFPCGAELYEHEEKIERGRCKSLKGFEQRLRCI